MGRTGRLVCFPGFCDMSSCKVFKRLTGKSVILSKATSDMFSKVIFHLKMQISVAVEWVLFEMAGGAYLNFRFINTSANWVIECIRNCAPDRQWDSYSWILSVSAKFCSPENSFPCHTVTAVTKTWLLLWAVTCYFYFTYTGGLITPRL